MSRPVTRVRRPTSGGPVAPPRRRREVARELLDPGGELRLPAHHVVPLAADRFARAREKLVRPAVREELRDTLEPTSSTYVVLSAGSWAWQRPGSSLPLSSGSDLTPSPAPEAPMDAVPPMPRRKQIALIAHDNRKPDLLEWARFNRETLAQHELYATGTTGAHLADELDLPVTGS